MLEKLQSLAKENKTILCFGIDPKMEKIKQDGTIEEKITAYYSELVDKLLEEHQIAAIKPNYAYFAQHGFEGLHALKKLIDRYKEKTYVIFDGKRGDIGKSSQAYANEVYNFWHADACTISPYMGEDSVKPFLRDGKTVYLLCRTSNPGAKNFQELACNGKQLYEYVAEKSLEWNAGLVIGATSDAIKKIAEKTKNQAPFLIPGIGAQGGDLNMVLKAIKNNIAIHRINASSSLAFAYEKSKLAPAQATLKEAEKLNKTIRTYF